MSVRGTFEPYIDVRSTAAFGGDPDIEPTSPNDRVWTPGRTLISVLQPRLCSHVAGQAHREHRALARLARHRHVAAHHARELPRERKAESGSAVASRGQGVRLGEILEQFRLLFCREADAAIRDGKLDPVASVGERRLDDPGILARLDLFLQRVALGTAGDVDEGRQPVEGGKDFGVGELTAPQYRTRRPWPSRCRGRRHHA
jgi:hypothetical protein